MIDTSIETIAGSLTQAGIEIYRRSSDRIQIAERVRMHLMDSGVSVSIAEPPTVQYAVRCQRSDFPTNDASDLFERVRTASAPAARDAGFVEVGARTRTITDPMDDSRVLDTWLEVLFERAISESDELTSIVTWALSQPKYVQP
ncbi:MAG: hypothetical protein OXU20_42355 [Myxococcales bacterium]|nr:hypothetical protein [Myxococcales bacterium]MDD9968259.1 hypothetical protein [Myxococcales bacterium]